MLSHLIRYARDHDLVAEPGFAPKSVLWALVFDQERRFLDILPLGGADKKDRGRTFPCCPDLSQPELVSGREERCHFLIETAQVVALLMKGDDDERAQAKARGKHAFFTNLLRRAAAVMPELARVAEALDDPETLAAMARRMQSHKVKPTDKVTIAIDAAYPVASTAWHDWWRAFRQELTGDSTSEDAATADPQMRCLATGRLAPPLTTHPKITGLSDVGGLGTGDALICFDKEAFRSYGLEQSANAAVSANAAAAYRATLNDLIQHHGTRLAGAKIIHWYDREIPSEYDFFLDLGEPREIAEMGAQTRARKFLESIRSGNPADRDLGRSQYFALTLSGASGRVMVRDWMEGQFATLAENTLAWFADLSIVSRDGQGLAPDPKFFAVIGAVTRDLKTVPPPFIARMWHVAVTGAPMPRQAMAQTLARVRVDIIQDVPANHARMGLLKAYCIRRSEGGIPMSPYLNEAHPAPAYHCGRLLAVLANLQRAALGDVGAGVVQRFYAAASATPALVLGRLTRTSQFHLGKLEGGLSYWYEQQLAGIWTQLRDQIPATLTLEEQSLFALGYYQQLAALRNPSTAKDTQNSNTSTEEDEQ